ncbi:hypothetical protein LSCM1_08022 [Leishmania martiniquensis]|uniref:WD repeat-containing protein 54 beta-propeller domain-containing protein n=1 Tax=Leishmania martiniquensis TaxID=1580590 RepID=A0A836H4M5_9TRYP|nr:hypothetical protein LSCM1_08022 [Leishmania martiniquensis]
MSFALAPHHEVVLPHSPALLYNNLQLHHGGAYVSYATDSAVYTIQASTGAPHFPPLRFSRHHVRYLAALADAAESIVLVVVLSGGMAIIIVDGDQAHVLPKQAGDAALTCAAVARVAGRDEMLVAFGASNGIPLCCRYTLKGQPVPSVEGTAPVQAHASRSITALDLEAAGEGSSMMATGDAGGHVVLWTDSNPTLMIPPESNTDAVTCVQLIPVRDTVAVAYGGGQIRLIERGSGAVAITIQAHSRWINSMVYSAAQQWLASAAEDGQLLLWDISSVDPNAVCIARGAVANELPTGLAFVEDSCALLAASYDVLALRFFFISDSGRSHGAME